MIDGNEPFRFDPAEVGARMAAQTFFRVEYPGAALVAHEDDPVPKWPVLFEMPLDG